MTSTINKGFMKLQRRAEKNDLDTLVATFVDTGFLSDLLSSTDNQIMYGRRGTGKTHALKYLGSQVQDDGDLAVYIDMRTIGSTTGLYGDHSLSVSERGTRLLIDAFEAIHTYLVDYAIEAPYKTDEDFDTAVELLNTFVELVAQVRVVGEVKVEASSSYSTKLEEANSLGLEIGSRAASLKAGLQDRSSIDTQHGTSLQETGVQQHTIHFGAITRTLEQLLDALPIGRLWILLDEWSELPADLQPLLADFIRRSLFPIGKITVKIGAIEQRSKFLVRSSYQDRIGIEIGSDASADLDLDDFMVYSNNVAQSKNFFREMLYRHVLSTLSEPERLRSGFRDSPSTFIRLAFNHPRAFNELVRAAEGVPRDAINIVALAAQRARNNLISTSNVQIGARSWYMRDKEAFVAVDEEASNLLHWIVDIVVSEFHTPRFFLEHSESVKDKRFRFLHDSRVVHLVQRDFSHRSQPGVRFDKYTLDYGCYIQLSHKGFDVAKWEWSTDYSAGSGSIGSGLEDGVVVRLSKEKVEYQKDFRQHSTPLARGRDNS